MKKKIILFNTLVLIVSLVLFLIVSVLVVSSTNQRNMESEIRSYLSVIEEEYEDENKNEIADEIHAANNKIRITYIASDGTVLYDTSLISEENHLTRPEIENLGNVYHRYSETTGQKMFYVAAYVAANNVYIRVSMPESSITDMTNTLVWSSIAAIVIISLLSALVMVFISNKTVEPLKAEIAKLQLIAGDDSSYMGNDIERMSYQIDCVRNLIRDKIDAITEEKKKVDYIMENIPQGLIILNGRGDVILVNKIACEVFKKAKDDILNKNYLYFILNKDLTDSIEKCMISPMDDSIGYASAGREYSILLSSLKASFVRTDEKYGVSLFLFDVTEEKKLSRMKTDFFANASHELKSPLTSIIGYQQMIEEGILTDPAEIADATKKTINEAGRMNQILTEMLELSHLEQKTPEEKMNLSIAKVTDEILSSYDVLLTKKKINVTKVYSDFEVTISTTDLYHLLRNLIDNAVKYNKDDGNIILHIDDKKKTFEIEDTGIGIAKENIGRIYERFYRVDKARSKEQGGTGLGLAIVKHIVMNNNLNINVDSTLGKGTKFTIFFDNKEN